MEQKPDKLIPALIGGAIIAVLSTIPILNFINCFCCAGVILGGYFAVFFYKRNLPPDDLMTTSDGALLGILAGIFGVIFATGLNFIIGTNMEQALEQISRISNDIPPELQEIIYMLKENSGKFMLANFAMSLIVDILFGMLGGIIGVSILGKKRNA